MSGRFWLGAKLGAIRGGRRGSCVDPGGIGSLLLSHVWTDVDTYGHRLEIYGSEGWGFGSLRACCRKPCTSRGFHMSRAR
jgi:hypothetical protein